MPSRWKPNYLYFTGLLAFGVGLNAARAEHIKTEEDFFSKGARSISVGSGYMFSPFLATTGRPTADYTLTELRLGYMLCDPMGSGFLRGNFEAGLQIFGGAITKGKGDYLAGGGPWLRYNFVPKESRFTPYLQIGAGVVNTDVDRELLGQSFNFNLEAAAGLRCAFSSWCALSLEFRYQHISNAGMSDRNLGINACGPMLTFSYAF